MCLVDKCIRRGSAGSGWIFVFCPAAHCLIDLSLFALWKVIHVLLFSHAPKESEWGGIIICGNISRSVSSSECHDVVMTVELIKAHINL